MSPSDPIRANPLPKPVDRSATRAIYIVVAEDPTTKTGVQEYRANQLEKLGDFVQVKGPKLTPQAAEKLRKNPSINSTGTIHETEIPAGRIIRIENITYQHRKA